MAHALEQQTFMFSSKPVWIRCDGLFACRGMIRRLSNNIKGWTTMPYTAHLFSRILLTPSCSPQKSILRLVVILLVIRISGLLPWGSFTGTQRTGIEEHLLLDEDNTQQRHAVSQRRAVVDLRARSHSLYTVNTEPIHRVINCF